MRKTNQQSKGNNQRRVRKNAAGATNQSPAGGGETNMPEQQIGENLPGESQASSLPGALTGSEIANNPAGAQQQQAKTKKANQGRQTNANSGAGATTKKAARPRKEAKNKGSNSMAGVTTGPGSIARPALDFIQRMRSSNRRLNVQEMRKTTEREFSEILNGVYPPQ